VSGKIPMTIAGILKAAQQPSDECAKLAQYKYVPLMVIVWALSIVDAYRLGRKAHIK